MTGLPDSPHASPPPTLSARERKALKAKAHALEPVVRVGQAGLTDHVVASIDRALTAHQLIKVKIGEGERDSRASLGDDISARTGAAIVQRVGRIVVLWRPAPEDSRPRSDTGRARD